MKHEIIIAGFGGQGVLLIGRLLAYAGMYEGKEVTWMPSYGAEMRGGTANCSVIISDEKIGAPIVPEATAVIVMNRPSLDTFESSVTPGGLLLVNSSLIDVKTKRTDVEAHYIPCNEIAAKVGNARTANIVMLGAFIELTKAVTPEEAMNALREAFGKEKEHLMPINEKALAAGAAAVRKE